MKKRSSSGSKHSCLPTSPCGVTIQKKLTSTSWLTWVPQISRTVKIHVKSSSVLVSNSWRFVSLLIQHQNMASISGEQRLTECTGWSTLFGSVFCGQVMSERLWNRSEDKANWIHSFLVLCDCICQLVCSWGLRAKLFLLWKPSNSRLLHYSWVVQPSPLARIG